MNLHTPEVKPGSIPVPFNAGHVSPIGDRTAIYEALARLGVHPGGVAPMDWVARAFERIENSTDIEDFEAFLADFGGDGKQFYIRLARKKIAELSAGRGGVVVAKPAEVPLPQAGDVFLRIEPGMHTATINRIGVDAAGTLMVTGSDDKTARLWALPQGGRGEAKLLRTLRVPIGEGDDGKVYAVALSPDGKWVAAGGYMRKDPEQETVYIFEAATGGSSPASAASAMSSSISPFRPMAAALPRRLAAKACGCGRRRSWRLLAEDKDYGGKDSYGAAFDGANRLYTVALDGQIRRYGADGRLEAKAKAAGGAEPFSIAVHPKGGKLAIGFNDTTAVEVYDAASLKRLYAANTDGISGGRSQPRWPGPPMARGFMRGDAQAKTAVSPLLSGKTKAGASAAEAPLSRDTIMQLLPCGAGIAAGARDPAFGLIAADGGKARLAGGRHRRYAGQVCATPSRSRGRWQERALRLRALAREAPVLFDLAAFRLAMRRKRRRASRRPGPPASPSAIGRTAPRRS